MNTDADLRFPPTEAEITETEREAIANHTFGIIFGDVEHRQYEEQIRFFCAEHAHPSVLLFLHLPVAEDLILDCAWDNDRDCVIVTEATDDDLIQINMQAH